MKISDQRAMKRGIVFVLIAILIAGMLAFFSAAPKKSRAATVEMDQLNYPSYYVEGGYKYYIVQQYAVPCQKFMPGKSVFASYVDLPIGNGSGAEATVELRANTGPSSGYPGNILKTFTARASEEFDPTGAFERFTQINSEETSVTVGSFYWLCLYQGNNNGLHWYYNDPSSYDSGYAGLSFNGSSIQGQANQDFGFRTFGYNPDQPAGPTGDQGSQGTTGTTGTGETLGTATASIAKPTNLTATYSDADRGVKLAWKASTTSDIDGYKIFRSESSDKGYVKVGEVKKDKVDYLDLDIAAGKTYYYQVRAYKGSNQSYSSNTASVKIPDDIAPAKPKNLTVIETTTSTISLKWTKNTAGDLKGYTISLYKGDEKVRTKDLKPDVSSYSFLELENGTVYKIELIAKDNKDKLSTPATTFASTEYPEGVTKFFDRLTIIGSILILGLLGYLIYRVVISRKTKRIE